MELICLAFKNKSDKKINRNLEDSCFVNNIKLIIIEVTKYNKEDIILDNLQSLKKEYDTNLIICVVEYETSLILESSKKIINSFYQLNLPFLFSSESELKFLLNYSRTFLIDDVDFCYNNGELSLVNSKMFMGYIDDLLDLFIKLKDYYKKVSLNSDKLNSICNLGYKINIDNNNDIFYNFNNSMLLNEKVSIQKESTTINKSFIKYIVGIINPNSKRSCQPFIVTNLNNENINLLWNSKKHFDNDKIIYMKNGKISIPKYLIYLQILIIIFIAYFFIIYYILNQKST